MEKIKFETTEKIEKLKEKLKKHKEKAEKIEKMNLIVTHNGEEFILDRSKISGYKMIEKMLVFEIEDLEFDLAHRIINSVED